jgi:hypothetical protein
MKSRIKYWLNYVWASFIAFSFPICLVWILTDITGNGKGFGYDLGSEKNVSILFGCVELLVWLVLALPSNVYVFRSNREKGVCWTIGTVVVFVLLFLLCVHLIGGWNEFQRCFYT